MANLGVLCSVSIFLQIHWNLTAKHPVPSCGFEIGTVGGVQQGVGPRRGAPWSSMPGSDSLHLGTVMVSWCSAEGTSGFLCDFTEAGIGGWCRMWQCRDSCVGPTAGVPGG